MTVFFSSLPFICMIILRDGSLKFETQRYPKRVKKGTTNDRFTYAITDHSDWLIEFYAFSSTSGADKNWATVANFFLMDLERIRDVEMFMMGRRFILFRLFGIFYRARSNVLMFARQLPSTKRNVHFVNAMKNEIRNFLWSQREYHH